MSLFKEFRSLPKKVMAVQFTDKNKDQVRNELTGQYATDFENGSPILKVTTVHGEIAKIRIGDWIVKDADLGTYYPVKPEIFIKQYASNTYNDIRSK